jgi:hypothetical protein
MTALPDMDTNCTTPSPRPTVNGNTVRGFYSTQQTQGSECEVCRYGFAFGGGNWFIGDGLFALHDLDEPTPTGGWQHFLFQWAFAAAAATIVSGAVAERSEPHLSSLV